MVGYFLILSAVSLTIILSMMLLFLLALISEMALRKRDKTINELKAEKQQLQSVITNQVVHIDRANFKFNDLKSLQTYINYSIPYTVLSYTGDIKFISKRLKNLLDITEKTEGANIVNLLSQTDGQQQYFQELLSIPRSQIWNREQKIITPAGNEKWLKMTIIPQDQQGRTPSVLLVCQDISQYVKANEENEINSKQLLEQELKTHKLIALQVIQAQEIERERIGRDMHDGIGQTLTALKFNIESINLSKPEKAKLKLKLIKQLASDIIKQVRQVTFNLRPPELADYGINKGLAKLAEGVSGFTGVQVEYINKSNFNERLEPEIETNLYRITQEAVNNAVKYAKPEKIIIILNASRDMLSIKIIDDGIGFDEQNLKADRKGMGLNSMRERSNYINGRIFISSNVGEGSRITVNVPLKTDPMLERI